MRKHAYGNSHCVASHKVTTAYGTYYLCPSCVTEGHAGIKHGNVSERLPVDSKHICTCEHVDHMEDK